MKSKLINILTLAILLSLNAENMSANSLDPTIVHYNALIHGIDPKQAYFISLLTLALEKSTDRYGSYQMRAAMINMPQSRALKMVGENNILDIAWSMASIEREMELQAIYIPLLKGLMGYRIGIIRKGDQSKFSQLKNLQGIKKIIIGQGSDWPDTVILHSNGFNVIPAKDSNLVAMLLKGRFDYYPRSIHEPWRDLARYDELVLEKSILISYPAPIYFFVSKDNPLLAARVEYGLRQAINDGSFDTLFYSHPITESMIKKSELNKRTEFVLHNPLLSEKSAALLNEPQLWLTIETAPVKSIQYN
ncbi:substrate-binding periplasmic protein [Shewanella sp. A14]